MAGTDPRQRGQAFISGMPIQRRERMSTRKNFVALKVFAAKVGLNSGSLLKLAVQDGIRIYTDSSGERYVELSAVTKCVDKLRLGYANTAGPKQDIPVSSSPVKKVAPAKESQKAIRLQNLPKAGLVGGERGSARSVSRQPIVNPFLRRTDPWASSADKDNAMK
jgi:hypothetical protein